ncbi:GIY-YIG nuclease family protein [Ureibacillus sp. FSL K6-8385]|uniref:GIY-YIG nuclease family protein n=1 Tax=Ureibacillus terrenus TaxID=118246 RepID=A0A540UYB0_9BACL|nr:GIY-YIG nuclease family protein [Ureibacillus terrenus]MED3662454.1 GIY-YIG nuclease family protein [Ureibacillus terrenus]MED3763222.1 GIY-YIG nuclease family protein [Ureibacillus terrenus]TQE89491.1 GIY-YIG nuclease family protein [Ureibacillus terrenus]
MEKKDNHYFYVLECADSSLYAGYTNHLERRIRQHNEGKGAKYTRARRPVQCIYYEIFETKEEALKAEYAFKQLKRSEKIKYIEIGREKNEVSKKQHT